MQHGPRETAEEPIDLVQALRKVLGEEIGKYTHTNIDIIDFVCNVFDLEKHDCDQILSTKFIVPEKLLTKYTTAKREKALHKPFVDISKKLLDRAVKIMKKEPLEKVIDGYWDAKGNRALKQDGRLRKPDLLGFWKPVPTAEERPVWTTVKHIVEFKLPCDTSTRRAHQTVRGGLNKTIVSCPPGLLGRGKRARGLSGEGADHQATHRSAKRPRIKGPEQDDDEESEQEGEEPPEQDDADDSDDEVLSRTLTSDEVQLASYALEALASTNRYWVTGILASRCNITVCYFDRHMVACSSTFSLVESPEKLALVLYALNRCDHIQAGFDPHLRPWSRHTNGQVSASMKAQLRRPVKTVVGSFLEYEAADVEARADGEAAGTPISLRIEEVIRRPDDLISRGTTVYKVVRRLTSGAVSDEHYAFKLSSPLAKRKSEFEIVNTLRKRLPKGSHDHFPRFLLTLVFTSEQLHLRVACISRHFLQSVTYMC